MVAFAKAEEAELEMRVMLVKNSMLRFPLMPVAARRGAPAFGAPPWPWFALGCSKIVSGDEGPDAVEDMTIVVVLANVVLAVVAPGNWLPYVMPAEKGEAPAAYVGTVF